MLPDAGLGALEGFCEEGFKLVEEAWSGVFFSSKRQV